MEALRHALLPGIAIAAYGMAEVARQLRGSLLEVLSSQYVRTLHAKGLSMSKILWQHGLKNVSVNLFTIISLLVNRMLAATVVVEAVFAIPGMGSLIVRGAIQRDFPIVQGVVFAMVIVVILVNLIADLLCARPSIRGSSNDRHGPSGRTRPAEPRPRTPLLPLAGLRPARGAGAGRAARARHRRGRRAVDRALLADRAGREQHAGGAVRTHLLGTDDLGRDIFSRLIYGAPATVYASLLAVSVAIAIGLPVGLIAGFFGGWIDDLISRVIDTFLSFPAIVLAIAVTGALGIGLTNGMIAVGIVMFPSLARIVRARTLIVRQELYVDASRCFGAPAHILWKHVLPNSLQPVIVQVTLLLAAALLAEASLSFLGLGIQPPNPSWGAMLARAYQYMEIAPEQMYAPGLAILVIALAFNALGEVLAHRARSDHEGSLSSKPETFMPFHKLLIANRGEIAIRISRAAGEAGLATVAIHPADDALSLHVRAADESFEIPGRGARAYLDIEAVIAAAKATNCDALHPGYGFLSENSQLARRCAEEGIVFVGPSPEALDLFGDKIAAKQLAKRCGVPVIEGTSGPTTLDETKAFFASLGAGGAVMIKAVAGGGGRGMRFVEDASKLDEAYARCQSEAKAAFGNDSVYVERLIRKARHIEVQIIGDHYGAISHLWERECTIQRRNQKLIEVAPSPSLSDGLRARIIDAARQLAAAAHYDNLGTFEFLVDGEVTVGDPRVRLYRGQSAAAGRAHRDRRGARRRSGEVAARGRRRRDSGLARPGAIRRPGAARLCHAASHQHGSDGREGRDQADRRDTRGVRSAVRPRRAGRYLWLCGIQDKCGLRFPAGQGHRSFAQRELARCRAESRARLARVPHRGCRHQYSVYPGGAGASRFCR